MTCLEFLEMSQITPEKFTTAERNAFFNHWQTCKPCAEYMDVLEARVENIYLTEEEEKMLKDLVEKDAQDSEGDWPNRVT